MLLKLLCWFGFHNWMLGKSDHFYKTDGSLEIHQYAGCARCHKTLRQRVFFHANEIIKEVKI